MTAMLDIITLWLLTCLFFREQLKWRIGHVIWIGLLVGLIYMSNRDISMNTDVLERVSILPFDYIETLIIFCILTLLANSYLFKREHVTILLMTLLSLIVWLIVRMQAVLIAELLTLQGVWNHILGLVIALLLVLVFTRYIGYVSFEKMTLLQQFVLYSVFFGSMATYGFYMVGISTIIERILIGCSILLCVFFTLFIYTQKRQQAMLARLQATEEYVPVIDELVMEVRSRQHEFSNKMLAITSILETADSIQEAKDKIIQFTDTVKMQPHQQQLLTIGQKIVAGFLYAKLRRAEQMGIKVEIDFALPPYKMPCEESDLVEILGILLDNAFEACKSGETVVLVCKLEGEHVRIEVSNPSPVMSNDQMMKMFELGYSSKSGKRGFGLHNFKQIAKQYNAKIILRNEMNKLTIGLLFTE
ncbi:GHKL domain-containing protein [Solibacillus sp. FSL W8-0372]|uniref:sensor histidine kinase n=1 Tax=Solibacillus sp. FSL W8-0372 TaxID=2921713 RepID=UPI0030CA7FDB